MLTKTDPDIIKGYLEDSSNLSGGHAEGVYIPENEKDIREIITRRNQLTVSAGETGTTGGCIPFGGWVVSMQRLNKIIDINPKEKYAIVEPGVSLEEIEKAVAKENLLYAPDPTEKKATIGGNVATNASGGRGYRFGSTRDHIRRLKIVTPKGEILNLRREKAFSRDPLKNSAGYYSKPGMEQIDLFIGMEGTLGIVSEVEIALVPALQETFDIVAFFPSEELAVDFVLEAKKKKDPTVNFFEYFDENTLQMLRPAYSHIPEDAKAAVYIEQEITAENENNYLDDWAKLLEKYKVDIDSCWLGIEPDQKEDLKKFRHAIPEHINELYKQEGIVKMASDIAVPTDKFKEMYDFYNLQLTTYNLQLFHIKFGHIGENHLHVNLLPKTEEEKKIAKDIIMKYVKKGISLGGTVSAEHGIGKIKHQYLKEMYGEAGINEMIQIKKDFDPRFILNRGNIFNPP
ncbi:MAG: FAD-binding oxidoreductase [Candidatus Margulisiibacteriota bacterium]|nr:FAD-binding oxidoreductase [Candidatus Margulisiibacteriota bacterium]